MPETIPTPSPKDLGIFIRDLIEDSEGFTLLDWGDGEIGPRLDANGVEIDDRITSVDATAPNKLIVYCESGAAFTVRVTRYV